MTKRYLITTERRRTDIYHLTFTVDAENLEEAQKKADEDYYLPEEEEWIDTEYVNIVLGVEEKETRDE
jgi:hypothetical protein